MAGIGGGYGGGGLGLARGIESGLRIAQDYRSRTTAEERQARLDAQGLEQQQRTNQREDDRTSLAAIETLNKNLAAEGVGLADADDAAKTAWGEKVARVRKAQEGILGRLSSTDVQGSIIGGQMDLKALQAGADPSTLPPGHFTRAITVSSGRMPKDFLRGPNGEPAPLEQAVNDLMEADGDHDKSVPAANVIFQPELRRAVGKTSRYGSKITDQKIIGIIPDPNSPPDDPRVFLQTRVYVNNGKDFRGPRPDGSPDGATGHYDSVITANRSADPNDPPKSISMKAALDKVGVTKEAIDAINRPEARAKLDEDAKAGTWDPEEFYQRAMVGLTGAKGAKETTENIPVAAGGSVLRIKKNAQGKEIGRELIQGNPKPTSGVRGIAADVQDIEALVTSGRLTEDEAEKRIQNLVAKKTTGTKAQGLAAGGGGGGKGGGIAGPSKEELKDIREQEQAIIAARSAAINEFKVREPKAPKPLGDGYQPQAVIDAHAELQRAYDEALKKHEAKLDAKLSEFDQQSAEVQKLRTTRAEERRPGTTVKPGIGDGGKDYSRLWNK